MLLRILGAWASMTREEKVLFLMQPDVSMEEKAMLLLQPEAVGSQFFVMGGHDATGATQAQAWGYNYASWTVLTNMTGVRAAGAAVRTGDSIYVVSGTDDSDVQNNMWLYSIANNSWTTKANTPYASNDHTAVVDIANGNIYMMGGRLAGNTTYGNNERYNIAGNSWSTMASFPSSALRFGHAAVLVGGDIYVFGGNDATSVPWSGTPYRQTWKYSIAGNSWTTGLADMPDDRFYHVAAADSGKIYVFGGRKDAAPPYYYDQTWCYNISGDSWTTKTAMPALRWQHSIAKDDLGVFYIVGGYDGAADEQATVWMYSPQVDNWVVLTPMPGPRAALMACG